MKLMNSVIIPVGLLVHSAEVSVSSQLQVILCRFAILHQLTLFRYECSASCSFTVKLYL